MCCIQPKNKKSNEVTYEGRRREIINTKEEINEIENQRGHKTKSLFFENRKKEYQT